VEACAIDVALRGGGCRPRPRSDRVPSPETSPRRRADSDWTAALWSYGWRSTASRGALDLTGHRWGRIQPILFLDRDGAGGLKHRRLQPEVRQAAVIVRVAAERPEVLALGTRWRCCIAIATEANDLPCLRSFRAPLTRRPASAWCSQNLARTPARSREQHDY